MLKILHDHILIKLLILATCIAIGLTPLYGLVYIFLICAGAYLVKPLRGYPSYIASFIVELFILSACIMVAGIFIWALKQPALLALSTTGLYIFTAYFRLDDKQRKISLINTNDVVALIIAIVAPIIICGSYLMTQSPRVGVYQFLANGYDNGSHLNMLQNNSRINGYDFHGIPSFVKKDRGSSDEYRGYPQGWHLATISFMEGFGKKVFSSKNPLHLLDAYLIAYLSWTFITIFITTRLTLFFAIDRSNKVDQSPDSRWLKLLLAIVIAVYIQMIVYWGSLAHGFPNYIACLGYIGLVIGFLHQALDGNKKSINRTTVLRDWLMALFLTSATVLIWILPLPALALSLLFSLAFIFKKKVPSVSFLTSASIRSFIGPVVMLGISCAAILAELLIYMKYSQHGSNQVAEGSLTGTFPVSIFLTIPLLALILIYSLRSRSSIAKISLVSTIPFAVLSAGIAYDQLAQVGRLSYYFSKSLAIVLLITSLFVVPAFMYIIRRLTTLSAHIIAAVVFISALCLLTFISGQSFSDSSQIFQKHSKIDPALSSKIVHFLRTNDLDTYSYPIVLTGSAQQDKNGFLYQRVYNKPYQCTKSIVTRKGYHLNTSYTRLESCYEILRAAHKKIYVITSPTTESVVSHSSIPRSDITLSN